MESPSCEGTIRVEFHDAAQLPFLFMLQHNYDLADSPSRLWHWPKSLTKRMILLQSQLLGTIQESQGTSAVQAPLMPGARTGFWDITGHAWSQGLAITMLQSSVCA